MFDPQNQSKLHKDIFCSYIMDCTIGSGLVYLPLPYWVSLVYE